MPSFDTPKKTLENIIQAGSGSNSLTGQSLQSGDVITNANCMKYFVVLRRTHMPECTSYFNQGLTSRREVTKRGLVARKIEGLVLHGFNGAWVPC